MHIPSLYIANSEGRGRGVFTAAPLSIGDVIEICPIILIPPEDLQKIHATRLHDYYFIWPGKDAAACIALGYGSIYNHSNIPCAEIVFDIATQNIIVRCTQPIEAASEIFYDYTGGVRRIDSLWFEPVE